MLSIVVTEPADLDLISGEIHDSFFDVADVRFDDARAEVEIPFRRWSTDEARAVGMTRPSLLRRLLKRPGGTDWEAPWYRWLLRVSDAESFQLVDKAQIGSADFFGIHYDPGPGVIMIEGNIPVTITVAVGRVNVSVHETDEVIGLARYTTWPSGADAYSGTVFPIP